MGPDVEAFVLFGESDISREDTLVFEDRDSNRASLSETRRRTDLITLALDTSTRGGSVALISGGQVIGCLSGDSTEAHSERLPGDVLTLLAQHSTALREIELFAVCVGPGSFTGLRVGLATVKGFALVSGRKVVPISSLEAVAHAGFDSTERESTPSVIVPWMNGQRGEVFASIYAVDDGTLVELEEPRVGTPEAILKSWSHRLRQPNIMFVGDGLVEDDAAITAHLKSNVVLSPKLPPLAPIIGILAEALGVDEALPAHSVAPLYVRRPDAELAREQRRPK